MDRNRVKREEWKKKKRREDTYMRQRRSPAWRRKLAPFFTFARGENLRCGSQSRRWSQLEREELSSRLISGLGTCTCDHSFPILLPIFPPVSYFPSQISHPHPISLPKFPAQEAPALAYRVQIGHGNDL